jgi:hypothetical protein
MDPIDALPADAREALALALAQLAKDTAEAKKPEPKKKSSAWTPAQGDLFA